MVPSIICAHESNRREAKKNNYRKVFFRRRAFLAVLYSYLLHLPRLPRYLHEKEKEEKGWNR